MPAAVAAAPVAVLPAARLVEPDVAPRPARAVRGSRDGRRWPGRVLAEAAQGGRRRLHTALGPRVMRVVVCGAATAALVPVHVVALDLATASALTSAGAALGLGAVTDLGPAAGALVAVVAWAVGTAIGVPLGTVAVWLALRPVAARDRRRLRAALDGATVVQGVGIRPGYGRSRAVELADGSVVMITRLVDPDDRGRQVGFTRSGGIDGVGRAAAAMALTAHQQAVGEQPWFPSLVDGRRPRRWGTFGTTP